jgi:hypothetical protein
MYPAFRRTQNIARQPDCRHMPDTRGLLNTVMFNERTVIVHNLIETPLAFSGHLAALKGL